MKNLENFTDLLSVGIGIGGAILKGIKKRIGMRNTILGAVVGGVLAYGTVGVIDQFFSHLNERIVIVISFAVGWVANEISDYLDDAIKALADKYINKLGKKIDPEN
jgi:hypothetical protein